MQIITFVCFFHFSFFFSGMHKESRNDNTTKEIQPLNSMSQQFLNKNKIFFHLLECSNTRILSSILLELLQNYFVQLVKKKTWDTLKKQKRKDKPPWKKRTKMKCRIFFQYIKGLYKNFGSAVGQSHQKYMRNKSAWFSLRKLLYRCHGKLSKHKYS